MRKTLLIALMFLAACSKEDDSVCYSCEFYSLTAGTSTRDICVGSEQEMEELLRKGFTDAQGNDMNAFCQKK